MPGSAPGKAGLSKTVPGHPHGRCALGMGVGMCLNIGEGTARQSPGRVEAQQDSNGKTAGPGPGAQAGATLQDQGQAEWSSHNGGAALVLQGPGGEAGEVRGLRTKSWVQVLAMNRGVQRGEPVGLGSLGKESWSEGGVQTGL